MGKAFIAKFKLKTAKLVLEQHYTYEDAAKAMNVSRSAISRGASTVAGWKTSVSNDMEKRRQGCHDPLNKLNSGL